MNINKVVKKMIKDVSSHIDMSYYTDEEMDIIKDIMKERLKKELKKEEKNKKKKYHIKDMITSRPEHNLGKVIFSSTRSQQTEFDEEELDR